MKNIPEIKIIRDNLEEELDVFSGFLFHGYYTQNKKSILRCFPELAEKIEGLSREESKNIIHEFLVDFYAKNRQKIDKIIGASEVLIKENSGIVLAELAKLMEYRWVDDVVYYAVPTILPFSPFNKNKFNFSILAAIKDKPNIQNNALFVAVHEISHFLFFDIFDKIIKGNKIDDFQQDTKNYFKETLTAVLLNQKPLCDILRITNYKGNPETHDINIKKQNGNIVSFYDFILENYLENSFDKFILKILNTLSPLSAQFSEKWNLWRQYGMSIYKDENLLREYRKPIEI